MRVLERVVIEHVTFNPHDSEHRVAYLMLMYESRQHPNLRFVLEQPFTSLLNMMQVRMADALCHAEIQQRIQATSNRGFCPA